MSDEFEQALQRLRQWVESAQEEGWLDEKALAQLDRIEQQQAEALFAQQGERPLIVAFFGGTGVGKSSLLNRLAGADIARVGVERPTSHEVTLYLHQDYQLAALPEDLPMHETRISYHHDDRRRLIAWLDLPDIDSVEARHRRLVEAWLPYVDWLIYVVSPERYQDDLGWRFVQQRGARHAWIFVINQWDQGATEQLEDFRQRLQREGFDHPLILRTSCLPTTAGDDDFARLEQTIEQAIDAYGLQLLQRLGLQARYQELRASAERFRDILSGYDLAALTEAWTSLVAQRLKEMEDELMLDGRLLAQSLAGRSAPWWRPGKSGDDQGAARYHSPGWILQQIWRDRFDTRLQDLAVELDNLRQAMGMPPRPFATGLEQLKTQGRAVFMQTAEVALAAVMARPGGWGRRFLLRLTGTLSWLLPLLAALWVGSYLVTAFYAGTRGDGPFLGLDFAIHGVLLIGLAWFVPWLLRSRLKPDLAGTVAMGLKRGIASGLDAISSDARSLLTPVRTSLLQQIERLDGVLAQEEKNGKDGIRDVFLRAKTHL